MKLKELAETKAHIKQHLEKHWGHDVSCSQNAVVVVMAQLEVTKSALLTCQSEKRAMWKALSKRCQFMCHTGNCYRDGIGKCTQRNCPLLKSKVKK